MKMNNLPENSNTPPAMPVASNGEAADSNSPGAYATCAPGALICPTRAELNAHWLNIKPSFAAVQEWHALIKFLDLSPAQPALN